MENSLSRYDKDSITDYVFDFSELDYISSSGLRILLNLTKKVMGKGKVVIQKPNEDVKNVFAMTGFDSFLELE